MRIPSKIHTALLAAGCFIFAGCGNMLDGTGGSNPGTTNPTNPTRGKEGDDWSNIEKPIRIPIFTGSWYDMGQVRLGSGTAVVNETSQTGTAISYLEFSGTSELTMAAKTRTEIRGSGTEGVFIDRRIVALDPYALGKYEVTRGLYKAVMNHLAETLNSSQVTLPSAWTGQGEKLRAPDNTIIENTASRTPYTQYLHIDPRKTTSQEDYYDPRAFLEYAGFDSPDGINFWFHPHKDFWQGTPRDDERWKNYFHPDNDNRPLGFIQWYEAVIFTNYLSILTGKTPAYDLHDGLDYDSKYEGKLFSTNEERWQQEFSETGRRYSNVRYQKPVLYYYDVQNNQMIDADSLSESQKAADPDWQKKARRNPVSWMASQRWMTTLMKNPDKYARETVDTVWTDEHNGRHHIWPPKYEVIALGGIVHWRPADGVDSGSAPGKSSNQYSLQDVARNGRFDFDRSVDGYRLPTEAEWEFAARGGVPSADPDAPWNARYAGTNELTQTAFGFNAARINVGDTAGNPLGLHEMSGSMAEWVWDLKGGKPKTEYMAGGQQKNDVDWKLTPYTSPNGEEINPSLSLSDIQNGRYRPLRDRFALIERVLRGGSWSDVAAEGELMPEPIDERSVLARSTLNKFIVQQADEGKGIGRWNWRVNQERVEGIRNQEALMGMGGKSTIGFRLAQTVSP